MDRGNNTACEALDQRQIARPFDGNGNGTATCDIGAFEARQRVSISDAAVLEGTGAGATYIWRYKPRQQAGYYVTMWLSNNGSFLWDGGSPNAFYGGHPYPNGGGNTTLTHN